MAVPDQNEHITGTLSVLYLLQLLLTTRGQMCPVEPRHVKLLPALVPPDPARAGLLQLGAGLTGAVHPGNQKWV